MRTYSELRKLKTFRERFDYLKVVSSVGFDTFGVNRYLNQMFYRSNEWRNLRYHIFSRDLGRDLGIPGYEISGKYIIHHMNPVTLEDIENASDNLLNPEFLITTSELTHKKLHYGENDGFDYEFKERFPNDTSPWLL